MDKAEYNKRYYEKNKEKLLEQVKEYQRLNRDKINERKRIRFQEDEDLREKRSKRAKEEYEKYKEYHKKYREEHKDRRRECSKEYNEHKGAAGIKASLIRKRYNISLEDLSNLLDSQKGCCVICKKSLIFPDSTRSYHIDHNHSTGKVRGLLCPNCNVSLGNAYEDVTILRSMIEYLEQDL